MERKEVFIENASLADLETVLGKLIDQKLDGLKQANKEEISTRYLTRKETAAMLHISLPTLTDWTKRGRISACKRIGKRVLYNLSDIKAVLENKKGGRSNG